MRDAMTAYDTAVEDKSPCWIARSAELIGDIFYNVYNYRQAEPYVAEAAENYLAAGKIGNHRYALCDLASVYMNEERTAEGIRLLDSLDVAVRSEQPVDSALLDYISTARTFGLFNAGRLEEIEGSPSGAETGGEDDADADVCIISSRLAYEGGDRDAAASLLSKAYGRSENERELIKVRYETYWQHMASGNYKEAALLADTLLHVQGEIVEGILNESVTGVQRDFYSEKVRYQEQKSGYILRLLVMVVVTAIVITALLIGMYRLRIRASRAELEANVSSLLQLKEQMMCVGAENRRLSEELDVQSAATEDLRRSLELTSQAEKHSSEVIEICSGKSGVR